MTSTNCYECKHSEMYVIPKPILQGTRTILGRCAAYSVSIHAILPPGLNCKKFKPKEATNEQMYLAQLEELRTPKHML